MPNDTHFQIAILGAGPIAAATARCLLAARPGLSLGMIAQEPIETRASTYLYAGGCVRLQWDDPVKTAAVQGTAAWAREAIAAGIDLDLIEDEYIFLNRGETCPGMNFAGAKLVRALIAQAERDGATSVQNALVSSVSREGDRYRIESSAGAFTADRVVAALGVANRDIVPGLALGVEKRQAFVLDTPVPEGRRGFPHLVAPLGDGVAYVFVKNFAGSFKLVVGQEDVVEHTDDREAQDYYGDLVEAGLTRIMPFLEGALVERILWGFDATNKLPALHHDGRGLWAVNCGSAVRSMAGIGPVVAEAALAGLSSPKRARRAAKA